MFCSKISVLQEANSDAEVYFMDKFGCDYECRTVGESIIKYNIPNDWRAEFDAYDDVYPVICVQVDEIR